jgi:hypothetical protein
MKATILIQDITVHSCYDLDIQELKQIIGGGYSWAEFEKDVSDFFDGVAIGYKSVH